MESWEKHYDQLAEKKLPPSATLLKALDLFEKEPSYVKQAIDLGCGTGIDTLALLKKGWKVMAIDKQPEAIQQLKNSLPISEKKLELITTSFELMKLPVATLMNASFSLPFCHPDHFESLWNRIENSLAHEGRFAGQLFGLRDSWATNNKMTFHSEQEIRKLFESFTIELFKEMETDGKTINGTNKHWHVFHIIAKKKK